MNDDLKLDLLLEVTPETAEIGGGMTGWFSIRCLYCGCWSQYKLSPQTFAIKCWSCDKFNTLVELESFVLPSVQRVSENGIKAAEEADAAAKRHGYSHTIERRES